MFSWRDRYISDGGGPVAIGGVCEWLIVAPGDVQLSVLSLALSHGGSLQIYDGGSPSGRVLLELSAAADAAVTTVPMLRVQGADRLLVRYTGDSRLITNIHDS